MFLLRGAARPAHNLRRMEHSASANDAGIIQFAVKLQW
jgi:hypothetical protein